jgi:feruloyl-CoA synthase
MNGPTGYAVALKRPAVDVKRLADGGYIFRSPYGMRDAPPHANIWLKTWAENAPGRPFLIETDAKGRKRSVTYAQTRTSVLQLAAALESAAQGERRAVVAFAANSIDTAILHLAVLEAGLPLVTFDPDAGARGNGTAAGLESVLCALVPALVYADSGERRAKLLELAIDCGAPLVAGTEAGGKAVGLKQWLKSRAKGPDPHNDLRTSSTPASARIYFDNEINPSGIGVTARNLTLNQEAVSALLPPLGAPVTLAAGETPWWQPKGTWGLVAVLRAGGTLHIGEAADGIKPTLLLADHDEAVALADDPKRFAALERILVLDGIADPALALQIQELASRARGVRVPLAWGHGAPGTGTLDALLYFETETPKNLGLPPPGAFLKLTPVDDDFELKVKPAGDLPQVWTGDGLAPCVLDEDGFLATGDIVQLIDPMRPYLGLRWLGRRGTPLT